MLIGNGTSVCSTVLKRYRKSTEIDWLSKVFFKLSLKRLLKNGSLNSKCQKNEYATDNL